MIGTLLGKTIQNDSKLLTLSLYLYLPYSLHGPLFKEVTVDKLIRKKYF